MVWFRLFLFFTVLDASAAISQFRDSSKRHNSTGAASHGTDKSVSQAPLAGAVQRTTHLMNADNMSKHRSDVFLNNTNSGDQHGEETKQVPRQSRTSSFLGLLATKNSPISIHPKLFPGGYGKVSLVRTRQVVLSENGPDADALPATKASDCGGIVKKDDLTTLALSLLLTIITLSVIICNTSSTNVALANNTWDAVALCVVFFLGASWYLTFTAFMDYVSLSSTERFYASIFHLVLLVIGGTYYSNSLTKDKVQVAIFCGWWVHVVIWAFIHAGQTEFAYFDFKESVPMRFFGLLVVVLTYTILATLATTMKRMSAIPVDWCADMEFKGAGICLAGLFGLTVASMSSGSFGDFDGPGEPQVGRAWFMLGYSAVAFIVGTAIHIALGRFARSQPPEALVVQRGCKLGQVFTVHAWMWGLTFWAHHEFKQSDPNNGVLGMIEWAWCATGISFLLLYLLSQLPAFQDPAMKDDLDMWLLCLCIFVAAAWTGILKACMEALATNLGYHDAVTKLLLTVFLFAAIYPPYSARIRAKLAA